ncbi:MAG: glycine--tRNA ligase subunit alpha/beta [Chloroflexi bacterium]|nr:MAG: glycine--tRNA ligase subunit alpha/beta [Chloroflexota bacterium]
MSSHLSFQEIILNLLSYWQKQGCLGQQPYNVQVGAGTMNPATALRVLGPEPWHVVYVEPSIRPDDGRFGDNPNRMQMHHQLQVILKPDPGNPQELYLKSLEAIGIDPCYHDIRFVEDNWESPALGAWGLGWEVWLDGQEITQFTYFQQAGGINLDPIAVEITYGLDRIALALQGVDSVWELDYGANIPYGDLLLQSEIEHCQYYFNVADVDAIRTVYDHYENEAKRCLEAGLAVPAHDYNLKCSHLFNILDTRGAIGVTERANYFHRMRTLARQVTEHYLAQREALGYPLKNAWRKTEEEPGVLMPLAQIEQPQTVLLEIGTEELPVADLDSAIAHLKTAVPALLEKLRLNYRRVEVNGTPRRLAVVVHRLEGRQADLETVVKGPPVDRAFDADGNPTKAAIGFARGKGVDVADLGILEEGNKRYVSAVIREEGQPTISVLADELPTLIASIKFQRSMRWNDTHVMFSRPIRWLVALYGPYIIPLAYAGVQSGRVSRGLRPFDSPPIKLTEASQYDAMMRRNKVVIDKNRRKAHIFDIATKLAAEKQGVVPRDEDLLNEVANLVEHPTPMRGEFERRFLQLPSAVLVAVMRKHQRYFPVYDRAGNLLPYFIAVRNGDERHLNFVVDGNEQVLKARFADAEFFYNNDIQHDLADFLPKLETLTFQAELGSMLAKVQRLEQLTPVIAAMLGLDEEETAVAERAASLAKADLATDMIVEMTSLQGVMGGHYARRSGESEAVAEAIAEQYQVVSQTKPGLALALADRLDSLTGLFAAGLAPKGSNDPFALRRAAIHLVENLAAHKQPFDLRVAVAAAADLQPVPCEETTQAQVLAFINGRLDNLLREKEYSASVTKAVLAEQSHDPYAAFVSATALQKSIQEPDWEILLDAYARCARITRHQTEQLTLRPADFALAAEQELATAYQAAKAAQDGQMATFVDSLRMLVTPINQFFDEVLVMDEEPKVRENRLALLQHIAHLSCGLADLSQLEGF